MGNTHSHFSAVYSNPSAIYQKWIFLPYNFLVFYGNMFVCIRPSHIFNHNLPTYCVLFLTTDRSPIFPFLKQNHFQLAFNVCNLFWISLLLLAFILLFNSKTLQMHYENFEGTENKRSFARRTYTKSHIWYLDTIDAFPPTNYSSSEPWCCIDKHTYLSLW